MDGDAIPVVEVILLRLDQLEFLFGIIDQRAQFFLLALADGVAKDLANLAFDVAGDVLQHVDKGLVLAVQIGQEVFSTFGQVENSLQIDDFACSIGHGRVGGRQQVQVSLVSVHLPERVVVLFILTAKVRISA